MANVTSVAIDFLGDVRSYPDMSLIKGQSEVTLIAMDLEDHQDEAGPFESPEPIEKIVFSFCSLASVPPMTGFPWLLKVKLEGCDFGGTNVLYCLVHTRIETLVVKGCDGVDDGSPVALIPSLKSLVITGCVDEYPHFNHHARGVLKAKLLSGELTGVLCKVVVNRLKIKRPERLASPIVQCGDDCCRLCDCKQPGCTICEELAAEGAKGW
jgi:hypothetical protein